jgi:phage baseplate assembly protein gpV
MMMKMSETGVILMSDVIKTNTKNISKTVDFSHELVKVSINNVELSNIHELTITRAINQHVTMSCSGVISGSDDGQRAMIDSFNATATIVVEVANLNQLGVLTGESECQTGNASGQILFQGRIRSIETLYKNGVYTVNVTGVSYTDVLDLIVSGQSFQDLGLSYQAVVQQTLQPFPEARFMDVIGSATTIGELVVRYQEAAWPFLIRLASRLNTGLVADATAAQPRFWFGVPCQNEWTVERASYTVHKNCQVAEVAAQNELISETSGDNGLYYELNGLKQLFQLGDQVNFNGQTLYVSQVVSRMTDSVIWHDYRLTTKAGLKQPRLLNQAIVGAGLGGRVIAVEADTLKVHLEIDAGQDETTAWNFPCATWYSAAGHIGWYCMPEIGDYVEVFFPNNVETAGYVTCSVRQNGGTVATDKITNPDVRYLRTPRRRELLFDQTGITITTEKDQQNSAGADLKIRFDQDRGIIVNSDQDITLAALTDLTLQAGQLVLTANKVVTLVCKESKLIFEPQLLRIEGTEINRADGGGEV